MDEQIQDVPEEQKPLAQISETPAEESEQPDEASQPPVQDEEEAPEEEKAAPAEEAPAKPEAKPEPNEVIITGQRPTGSAAEQQMEQQEIAKAFATGQIKPKTYQQLFDDQGILGKVGTLFGLLVGGAGSGLTHQPNVMLEMMNREIDRDLQAQMKSQENATNWYRLHQNYLMQKAQIPELQQRAELLRQQALSEPTRRAELSKRIDALNTEIEERKAQIKLINSNATKANMSLGLLHNLYSQVVEPMADGPQKQNALNALGQLSGQIDAQNASRSQQTEQVMSARQKPDQIDPGVGVNVNKINQMHSKGQITQALGVPPVGALNDEQYQKAMQEAQEVMGNRAIAKAYDDSFRKIKEAKLANRLNPEFLAAEQQAVNTVIAKQLANRYVTAEAAAQANALFPSITDLATGVDQEKYRKAMETFRNNESNKAYLDMVPNAHGAFPYSGAYEAEPKDVLMRFPDNSTRKIPKNRVEGMIKVGGKVVGE